MIIICFHAFTQNIGDIIYNDNNGPIIATVERIFEDGRIYYGYSLTAYPDRNVFAQLIYTRFSASLNIYIKKIENNFPDFDGIRILYQYNTPVTIVCPIPNHGNDEYVEYHSDLFIQNVDKDDYRIGKINDIGIIARANSAAYGNYLEESIEEINMAEYKMYVLDLPPDVAINDRLFFPTTDDLTNINNIIICLDGFPERTRTINFYDHHNYWLARFFSMVEKQGIK
jgi:hypothetical protein